MSTTGKSRLDRLKSRISHARLRLGSDDGLDLKTELNELYNALDELIGWIENGPKRTGTVAAEAPRD